MCQVDWLRVPSDAVLPSGLTTDGVPHLKLAHLDEAGTYTVLNNSATGYDESRTVACLAMPPWCTEVRLTTNTRAALMAILMRVDVVQQLGWTPQQTQDLIADVCVYPSTLKNAGFGPVGVGQALKLTPSRLILGLGALLGLVATLRRLKQ